MYYSITTPSVEKDHMIQLRAPKQLLNEPHGEIVSSTTVWKVEKLPIYHKAFNSVCFQMCGFEFLNATCFLLTSVSGSCTCENKILIAFFVFCFCSTLDHTPTSFLWWEKILMCCLFFLTSANLRRDRDSQELWGRRCSINYSAALLSFTVLHTHSYTLTNSPPS